MANKKPIERIAEVTRERIVDTSTVKRASMVNSAAEKANSGVAANNTSIDGTISGRTGWVNTFYPQAGSTVENPIFDAGSWFGVDVTTFRNNFDAAKDELLVGAATVDIDSTSEILAEMEDQEDNIKAELQTTMNNSDTKKSEIIAAIGLASDFVIDPADTSTIS